MTDVRKAIAILLKKEYQISDDITNELFERRILFEPIIRNFLIREEYKQKIQPKQKQRIKGNIANNYCISVDMVEKIVAKCL